MKLQNCNIKIIQADITKLKVDAIVNPANTSLVMGGGLAKTIKDKGGRIIEEEAEKKAPIKAGEAIFTSAGKLPSKFVIHSATMEMDFKTDEEKIRSATRNALRLAKDLKIKSVAFPALGCGTGGFPYLASAKIMAQEVFRHLREERPNLKEIIFCLYHKEAYEVFNKGVISYLKYITKKIQEGPFITVDAIIPIKKGILVVERSNPPFGLALPGGFVDYGESLESAIKREVKEETDLEVIDLKQFHTYSEPNRDPRFHTVSCVFIVKTKGKPQPGDDAQKVKIIKLSEIKRLKFAFDHKRILEDYLKTAFRPSRCCLLYTS
ncbi:MAG: macro domain-containing protein, partial [Candidatus Omnitrophica bacterium]|nr:macro domain-containing protein [Candidatus Omnitrophota bacterium]